MTLLKLLLTSVGEREKEQEQEQDKHMIRFSI
jgi:hypothetical protein